MKNIAIVENEQTDQQILIEHIARYQKEQAKEYTVTCYDSGRELLASEYDQFQVIFLDIDMEEINGLMTAKEIRKTNDSVILVFVTNMAGYAIEGYSVQALDFLVKPVNYFRVEQEMMRIEELLAKRQPKRIPVKVQDGTFSLNVDDIFYIETYGRKVRIHTNNQVIDTNSTMASYETMLAQNQFFRVHSSYLVNLAHVQAICNNCVLIHGEEILVSRHKKKAFVKALTMYTGSCL